MHLFTRLVAFASILALTACASPDERDHETKTGSLTHVLDMVDKDGRHYGTVELDPVGGGKVLDINGRLIGEVVPPEK